MLKNEERIAEVKRRIGEKERQQSILLWTVTATLTL